MKEFLKYFWTNSWKLVLFVFGAGVIPAIVVPWDRVKIWVLIIALIFVFNVIGDIFAFKQYQKNK